MNTKSSSQNPPTGRKIFPSLIISLLLSAVIGASAAEPVQVTELLTKALANVPGKEVTMITVHYAPGAADPVHRHNASAFVYVLEGTIEMQMKGDEKVTLKPGQAFYEAPDGVHLVGRNASNTEHAKFLVFLVKEEGAPVLVPASH
ncbi:cupin domain-containing protein [Verrucomicrobium sp. BvORR034]|uniref:cupin domain-containing protein n=1 Tax=Verrucomicrobium sp. BvORR034 TaxID=1396418 RepID=UPI000678A25A|nr:cupin domain-containing protein [Verrucomicrobium sp. BvORR034]